MMGGDVTVASEPGKGSVFTVRLPGGAPSSDFVSTNAAVRRFEVKGLTLILIASNERDLTTDYIVLELRRRACPFVRFNTENASGGHIWFSPEKGERGWTVSVAGQTIDFLQVRAGYLRRWLNPPIHMLAAENKPRQLALAAALGLRIPATIVTNCPNDVARFIKDGPSVVKPLRSALLESADGERVIFTSRIGRVTAEAAQSIEAAPFILQREIAKRFDIRVTVIGERTFATEIDSQANKETTVDWRSGSRADLEHRIHALPSSVAGQCIALTKVLELRFGAIDLIQDQSGQYWFLEINPNGQWAWIETRTGQPISSAIADELQGIASS
jgi:glutathione synthase/RimK-type ligase-like ATP-grasp enzyme